MPEEHEMPAPVTTTTRLLLATAELSELRFLRVDDVWGDADADADADASADSARWSVMSVGKTGVVV